MQNDPHGSAERTSPARQAQWLEFIYQLMALEGLVDSDRVAQAMQRDRSYANGFLKIGVERGLWYAVPATPPRRGHKYTLQPPIKQLTLPGGETISLSDDVYADFAKALNVDRETAKRRLLTFLYWALDAEQRHKEVAEHS